MSASYTLHVAPYADPGDPAALDRASLVRDGFAVGAFVAPPLWLFYHRHWLLGLALAVCLAGFWALLRLSGLPGGTVTAVNSLLWLLIGLEASTLRRWDYARQGRPTVDVVFAANEAEAEAKSFARWLSPSPNVPPRLPVSVAGEAAGRPSPWSRAYDPGVIGLFPDQERRR